MAVYWLLGDGGNTVTTVSVGPALHSREYAMMNPFLWLEGGEVQVNGTIPLVGFKAAKKLPGGPLGAVGGRECECDVCVRGYCWLLRLLNTCFRSDETDLVATRGGAIVVIGNHKACVVGPCDEVRVHTGHDSYYDDRIQRVPNPVSRIIN